MADDVKPEKTEEKKNVYEAGVRWLLGQEANTVLLFTIIIGIGYGVRFLVPQHLQMIQDGYEKINTRNVEEMKSITTHHAEAIKELTTSFDKTLDRIERLITKDAKPQPTAVVAPSPE